MDGEDLLLYENPEFDYQDNPWDDEVDYEDVELVWPEPEPKRRKRRQSNPVAPSLFPVAVIGIGLVIWRMAKGLWPWQSWQLSQAKKQAIIEAQQIATSKKNPGNPGLIGNQVSMTGYNVIDRPVKAGEEIIGVIDV